MFCVESKNGLELSGVRVAGDNFWRMGECIHRWPQNNSKSMSGRRRLEGGGCGQRTKRRPRLSFLADI